ncbi:MAG: acyl carrier protein, partial [Moorea sp. SIO3E2]|nr:acyl carrier protein [Moorena sp. SIO3E2]
LFVMVSRAVQKGLKSPYLRDIPHVQQTLAARMAAGAISFEETPSISSAPQTQQPLKTLQPLRTPQVNQVNLSEIKQVLKQQLAEALYTEESEIAEDQKFVDLGLDSIVGVEWTTTINQTYNLNLKATKLYDYPTLLELSGYIAQILSSQGTKPISSSSQTQQSLKTLQPLPTPQVNQVNLSEIKQVLKQQLAEALYTEESEIAEDQKFVDLGLDSIVGVEWTTTINQTYNLNLKATKLYDYPTLLELAAYIAQTLASQGTKPQVSQQPLKTLQPLPQPQVNLSEIKQVLKQQLAEALYTEESEIAEDQKFVDLGLDSIVGVEWTTTINQTYNLNLKATKLYDYPTLLELAPYIAQEIAATGGSKLFQGNGNGGHPQESLPNNGSPVNSSEEMDPKLRLRAILNKVAKKELTIQEANKLVQQIKKQVTV